MTSNSRQSAVTSTARYLFQVAPIWNSSGRPLRSYWSGPTIVGACNCGSAIATSSPSLRADSVDPCAKVGSVLFRAGIGPFREAASDVDMDVVRAEADSNRTPNGIERTLGEIESTHAGRLDIGRLASHVAALRFAADGLVLGGRAIAGVDGDR